jgi:hypothetical protein
METPLHSFPLPGPEVAKLDQVTNQVGHQRGQVKIKDFVHANPWSCMLAGFLLGLIWFRVVR